MWPQYTEIPTDRPPVPKGFDWDLWLGPALDRPYHPHYTHTVFRGWYDFGGGSMADMGIYSLWPVFTALDLGVPLSAEAWATHTCTIVDNVSRTDEERFLLPDRLHHPLQVRGAGGHARPGPVLVRRRHEAAPARGNRGAERRDGRIEGILFVGDQGTIMAGFNGQDPQLFAKGKSEPLLQRRDLRRRAPARARDRGERASPWLEAVKGGAAVAGQFPERRGRLPTPSTWAPSPCGPGRRCCSTART